MAERLDRLVPALPAALSVTRSPACRPTASRPRPTAAGRRRRTPRQRPGCPATAGRCADSGRCPTHGHCAYWLRVPLAEQHHSRDRSRSPRSRKARRTRSTARTSATRPGDCDTACPDLRRQPCAGIHLSTCDLPGLRQEVDQDRHHEQQGDHGADRARRCAAAAARCRTPAARTPSGTARRR